jgi:hypothetical protein
LSPGIFSTTLELVSKLRYQYQINGSCNKMKLVPGKEAEEENVGRSFPDTALR